MHNPNKQNQKRLIASALSHMMQNNILSNLCSAKAVHSNFRLGNSCTRNQRNHCKFKARIDLEMNKCQKNWKVNMLACFFFQLWMCHRRTSVPHRWSIKFGLFFFSIKWPKNVQSKLKWKLKWDERWCQNICKITMDIRSNVYANTIFIDSHKFNLIFMLNVVRIVLQNKIKMSQWNWNLCDSFFFLFALIFEWLNDFLCFWVVASFEAKTKRANV